MGGEEYQFDSSKYLVMNDMVEIGITDFAVMACKGAFLRFEPIMNGIDCLMLTLKVPNARVVGLTGYGIDSKEFSILKKLWFGVPAINKQIISINSHL